MLTESCPVSIPLSLLFLPAITLGAQKLSYPLFTGFPGNACGEMIRSARTELPDPEPTIERDLQPDVTSEFLSTITLQE